MRLSAQEARAMGLNIVYEPLKKGKRRKDKPAVVLTPEQKLWDQECQAHGLPIPDHEYRWNEALAEPIINPETGKPYRWRFDWLFAGTVAVEKIGGVWIRGRHSRGKEQIKDMKRRNEALIAGYIVLEFPPEQFKSGEVFETIKRAIQGE